MIFLIFLKGISKSDALAATIHGLNFIFLKLIENFLMNHSFLLI